MLEYYWISIYKKVVKMNKNVDEKLNNELTSNESKEISKNEIAIISEENLANKIYFIRGQKVMLDFELAEIYGYETKNFNRQVKNNIEKFEGEEFMFQLTKDDMEELSRCKNFTLNNKVGRGSNIKYMPHAFSEIGVYMLMTVLKGELATKQSRALVRTFRAMKDYIVENRGLLGEREYLQLSMQTTNNVKEIYNSLIEKLLKNKELKLKSAAKKQKSNIYFI